MFRCIDSHRQREVVVLDYEDDPSGLPELRETGRKGGLLCPECRQPVLVRAGGSRAWHFAHKDLGYCPLSQESAAVLQARRLLYRWLQSKFTPHGEASPPTVATVRVESMKLPGLTRPVDCSVAFPDGRQFGYWILEKGLRNRGQLEVAAREGILHPVFLLPLLLGVEGDEMAFDLSPTERGFIKASPYDPPYGPGDGSLHYLDCSTRTMTTLRALSLQHAPQRYDARRVHRHPLDEMLITKKGIFVHPGEAETFRLHKLKLEEEKREQERREQEWLRRHRERERLSRDKEFRHWTVSPVSSATQTNPLLNPSPVQADPSRRGVREAAGPRPKASDALLAREPPSDQGYSRPKKTSMAFPPLRCERCQQATTEWVRAEPALGTCLCRECCERRG